MRLTLHDAVVTALKQNPQTKIAALQAAEAAQTQNIARSQLLPQVQLAVGETRSRENLDALLAGRFPGFRNTSARLTCSRRARNSRFQSLTCPSGNPGRRQIRYCRSQGSGAEFLANKSHCS